MKKERKERTSPACLGLEQLSLQIDGWYGGKWDWEVEKRIKKYNRIGS